MSFLIKIFSKSLAFALSLFFSLSASSVPPVAGFSFSAEPLPYEANCSQNRIKKTLQFAPSETEGGFCFTCQSNQDSVGVLANFEPFSFTDTIPKECFLAIAVRGNYKFENRYNYCSSENNKRPLSGNKQRFCINEDYITAVHKSFKKMSYCFNFDKKTQEDIFHLINRESAGILNVRSKTGARCLGQITEDYVKDINAIIKSVNNRKPDGRAFIWTELLERCPDLKKHQINVDTISCQSTQNPNACLLYTFFGNKISLYNIQKRLNSKSGFMGTQEFPKPEELIPEASQTQARERYQNMLDLLPIKRKEMMIIRDQLKPDEEGKVRQVNWLMWDDSEIYRKGKKSNMRLYKMIDWTKPVKIEKVNIFENERDIMTMFMYWSHNGGWALSRDSFSTRINNLKREVSTGCRPNNKYLRCQMRRKIENGEKIPTSLVLSFFERDIKKNYLGGEARKAEVGKYVRNVIEARSASFEATPGNKNNNLLLRYHQRNDIDGDIARQFIEETSRICPKSLNVK